MPAPAIWRSGNRLIILSFRLPERGLSSSGGLVQSHLRPQRVPGKQAALPLRADVMLSITYIRSNRGRGGWRSMTHTTPRKSTLILNILFPRARARICRSVYLRCPEVLTLTAKPSEIAILIALVVAHCALHNPSNRTKITISTVLTISPEKCFQSSLQLLHLYT